MSTCPTTCPQRAHNVPTTWEVESVVAEAGASAVWCLAMASFEGANIGMTLTCPSTPTKVGSMQLYRLQSATDLDCAARGAYINSAYLGRYLPQ